MTQQVMLKLFKAIDSSQTLMLDDTVVSLCMYEGLTSIRNDVRVLLQNCPDSDCTSIGLQSKGQEDMN